MASPASAAASKFLHQHKISELREQHRDVITVTGNTTVTAALKVLQENNIISVPVVDEKVPRKDDQHFLGIVSILDIMTAAVFQPVFNTYDTDTKVEEVNQKVFQETTKASAFHYPVKDILGISTESQRLWLFNSSDSISILNQAFASGVHRVLVRFTDTNEVLFFSQSDVVRFLKKNAEVPELHEIFSQSLEELDLSTKKQLVTMSNKSTALTGFRRMFIHNELNALPIIDDKGVLVGTLSATDLRGMSADDFKNVLLPVTEFLQIARAAHRDLVEVEPEHTLGSVTTKIHHARVHRAWVVDKQRKPIGVVSLSDIIRKFSIYG